MITGLDHIGIAVNKIDEALSVFEKMLGLRVERVVTLEERKLKIAFLLVGESETKIELLEPLDREGTVAKFIERRGEGIQHLAFTVTDIENTLSQLKEKGVELIDTKPRVGAEGGKIAFLHPKSTKNVLIELCEPSRQ